MKEANEKISIEFDSQAFAEWIKNQPEEHLDMLQQIVNAIRKNKRVVRFDHAKDVKRYERVYQAEVSAFVMDHSEVLGFLFIENGCCHDRPVLLTVAINRGRAVYSCQCACGGWCTSGHNSPAPALAEYVRMTEDTLPF